MTKITLKSFCTLRLLAIASQAAYKIIKNSSAQLACYEEEGDAGVLNQIACHGYFISETSSLPKTDELNKTRINALCLSPQDAQSPIIISFRGTKSYDDFYSDLRLSILGVVEKKRREAAFAFYKKIRTSNLGREILLTGHSLGGHLAQYVASKAYSTAYRIDYALLSNPVVQARTFNAAPIKTNHRFMLDRHHEMWSQIINYRLSSDIISNFPLQQYHGNTFVFSCNEHIVPSHHMKTIIEYIPKKILDQVIGTSFLSRRDNLLIELINGIENSYECRINAQFFSKCRAGVKNLKKMEESFYRVRECLESKNHANALTELKRLKDTFQGKVSKKLVSILIHVIELSDEPMPIALDEPLIHNLSPCISHG